MSSINTLTVLQNSFFQALFYIMLTAYKVKIYPEEVDMGFVCITLFCGFAKIVFIYVTEMVWQTMKELS